MRAMRFGRHAIRAHAVQGATHTASATAPAPTPGRHMPRAANFWRAIREFIGIIFVAAPVNALDPFLSERMIVR